MDPGKKEPFEPDTITPSPEDSNCSDCVSSEVEDISCPKSSSANKDGNTTC